MKSHKEKIDELITLEKDDNLLNHISTSLFNRGETIAQKNLSEYTIWMRNYWVGTFYPIFKINFNEKNEIKNIKTELSLNGKFWAFILTGMVFSFLSYFIIIPMIENLEYLDFTILIVLGIYGFLVFGIYWVFRKIYLNETKYLLNELKVVVGLESNENLEKIECNKKEWTVRKTLTRLFIYPFSFFILVFSVIMTFQGNLKGLFGIIVITGYLYADVKILWDKRKK